MTDWQRVGRPGAIGSRKKEVLANYNKIYGRDNWRLSWDVNGSSVDLQGALTLYEDAYFEYLQKNQDELRWLVENFSNVYDNNPSNVNSGFDYSVQEFGGNHFQDTAIRRCLVRNGLWFRGKDLLEIRLSEPGVKFNPGEIPFHKPELIPQPEIKGWWKPGSIESWYQSARYLEVRNFEPDVEKFLYFVTSNAGKVDSAQRSLGDFVKLKQAALDITEEQQTIEKIAEHKARVAYSVLCLPVICDDSGLVIPTYGEWPGVRVGREVERLGEEGFANLFKDGPLPACFKMAVTYFDETLERPKIFVSTTDGQFQYEAKGDPNKPFIKNRILGMRFIVKGQSKTIAEMTDEEYRRHATTNRWEALIEFLKSRK